MTATEARQRPLPRAVRRRLIVLAAGVPLMLALLLFVPAGTWAWARGWLFIVVLMAASTVVYLVVRRLNPEVVIARAQWHKGTKRWDKYVLACYFSTFLATLPVAALDDSRFHWCPVTWIVCALGYFLLFTGLAILTWAEAVNKFFEPTVRIQTDRGHHVIDTGPYAIVRHPGYMAGILFDTGTALALGSLWALIPAGVASLVLVLRTRWEDDTLQAELAGYREYAQRVRYRWIPGVW